MQWILIDRIGHIAFYVLTKISGSKGATTAKQNVKHFSTIKEVNATIDSEPTAIDGWTVDGWREDTNAAAKTIANKATITMSGDKTIYAVYRRNATFYSGSNKAKSVTATQYYNTHGKYSLQAPSTVTGISGWNNKNWVTDKGVDVDFGATYTDTANVFYAKYDRTATFYHGINKAKNTTATQVYTSDNNFSLTTPAISKATDIKNGWAVQDWYQTSEKKHYNGSVSYTGSQNVFYAYYKRTITIKYANGGGTGTVGNTTGTQYYNSSNAISPAGLTLAANKFTRKGYNFSKWDLGAPNATVNFAADGAATKTATAVWTGYKYTVTYKQGVANTGWSATTYANQTANYPTAIKIRTNSMGRNATKKSEYKITFNANGGSVNPASATTYIPVSYTKNGWSTASAGTTQNYKDGASYSKSDKDNTTLTLYPCFKAADGARTSIKMPTPTKTNMTCTGWWTATTGGSKVFACGVSYDETIKNSQTVYAQWTNATVNFGAGGTYYGDVSKSSVSSTSIYNYSHTKYVYKVKFQLLAGKTWADMIKSDDYKWPTYYEFKRGLDHGGAYGGAWIANGTYKTRAALKSAAQATSTGQDAVGYYARDSYLREKEVMGSDYKYEKNNPEGNLEFKWSPKFDPMTEYSGKNCVFFKPTGSFYYGSSVGAAHVNLGCFCTSTEMLYITRTVIRNGNSWTTHTPRRPILTTATIQASDISGNKLKIFSDTATSTYVGRDTANYKIVDFK